MESDSQLKQQIIEQVGKGTRKNDLMSNLIFAGFAHKDIVRCVVQLTREGKIPRSYWEGSYSPPQQTPDYTTMEEAVPPPQQKQSWWSVNKQWAAWVVIGVAGVVVIGGIAWFLYSNSATVVLSRSLRSFAKASSFTLSIETKTNEGTHAINSVVAVQDTVLRYAIGFAGHDNSGNEVWSGNMLIPQKEGWYGRINAIIAGDQTIAELAKPVTGEWVWFSQQSLPQELDGLDPFSAFVVAENLSVGSGYDRARQVIREDIVREAKKGAKRDGLTPISFDINPLFINDITNAYALLSGYALPTAVLEQGTWIAWVDGGILRGLSATFNQPINGIESISVAISDYENNFAIEAPSTFITQERFAERVREAQGTVQESGIQ